MPSYDELDNEVWWTREYEPPALARFNSKLRAFYSLTRSQCGSKGDNRHLNGRHRSRNWDLNSAFCTNRSYATTDARDKRGPGDALRATDLGISGPPFWAACRRVDAAVRAGRLPQLAEWFGTFDGRTVVGWSNGRPASSDSSHLTHGHFGYWTESTDDAAFFELLFQTITGDDDMIDQTEWQATLWRAHTEIYDLPFTPAGPYKGERNEPHFARKAMDAKLDGLLAAIQAIGTTNPDVAAILAGVDTKLAVLREQIHADVDTELDEQSRAGADAD